MNYNSSQKTGGGCRPIGINAPAKKPFDREAWEAKFLADEKKRREEHEAWLLTPEGVEYIRKETESLLLEAKRQTEILEENKKKNEHAVKHDALRANPAVGTILDPKHNYGIWLQENPKYRGQISAYALCQVAGEYPAEPYRTLAFSGRRGLKVFLDSDSRRHLEKIDFDPFKRLDVELTRRAMRQKTLRENPDYWSDHSEETFPAFEWIQTNLPIQIIGISMSGKSVQGKFIQ